ncbi:Suppressor of tumorigenicity 14 protein [Homalodisca vitripennis]|nr:Suppressor of tumorigenicity 14 protein [Homalodisca vitripennis]
MCRISLGFGRNIRHLPCLSRRTGETGVCMFAFSCAKANGTHLGTCIDRFYFGSCCKVALQNEGLAEPLDSNHIFEETPVLSTESYHLSTYQSVQTVLNTTAKPTISVQKTTTPRTTSQMTTLKVTRKPTTTIKPTVSVPSTAYTHKPITSSKPAGTKPHTQTSTLKPRPSSKPSQKPPSNPSSKPSLVSRPVTNSSASKPPGKPVVSTKPKPSNTTTHSKPQVKPSPQKPSNGTITKPSKPAPTKRPVVSNTTKPSRPHPQKPAQSTSKPSSKPTLKPSFKPTSKPTQKPPKITAATKPQTKPTLKPVPVVTTGSSTDPNYIKVPVVTVPTLSKPSSESTTISNEVVQKPGSNVTNPTLDADEESSNVINGSPASPTTTSPLLVTWTTVDEVPVPPLPKPVSTPSSGVVKNETKPVVGATTQSSQTWVQVSVSTTRPSTESTKPDLTPEVHSTSPSPITQATVNSTVTIPTTEATTTTSTTTTTTTTVAPTTTTTAPTSPSTTTTAIASTTLVTTEATANNEVNTANLNMTNYLDGTTKLIVKALHQPLNRWSRKSRVQQTLSKSDGHKVGAWAPDTCGVGHAHCARGPASGHHPHSSILTFLRSQCSVLTTMVAGSSLNTLILLAVCGRRLFPQSRIVGGEKATFGKWPWQISLRQWRTSTYLHKCGAALLNENWAITAAHCVENVAPSDLLLRLGEHDLSLEDEPYGYQERRVQIVASHPQFDPRTFEYDLALLRFYEPVTFQPNIIPVCVPQDDTNFVGSTAYVTGWGRLYEDGPLPSVLQEVSVPVINNTVCETMYRAAGYIEHIPEIFICAGYKKGGFDSCEMQGATSLPRSNPELMKAGSFLRSKDSRSWNVSVSKIFTGQELLDSQNV